MLRMNGVYSALCCVGMLRGVEDVVFDPESFDFVDDKANPQFSRCLDKSDRSNVVDGDVLKYLWEWYKEPVLPVRTA